MIDLKKLKKIQVTHNYLTINKEVKIMVIIMVYLNQLVQ